jgi:tRNA 2-thiouridine synthesizing protein A
MAIKILDNLGLECPQPVLKIAAKSSDMKPGYLLEMIGDYPTFEKDIRAWCQRLNKLVLSFKSEGNGKLRCQIQF